MILYEILHISSFENCHKIFMLNASVKLSIVYYGHHLQISLCEAWSLATREGHYVLRKQVIQLCNTTFSLLMFYLYNCVIFGCNPCWNDTANVSMIHSFLISLRLDPCQRRCDFLTREKITYICNAYLFVYLTVNLTSYWIFMVLWSV